MIGSAFTVLLRDREDGLNRRAWISTGRKTSGHPRRFRVAEPLTLDLITHEFGEYTRHRVAQLALSRSSATFDLVVIGEGLNPT